MAVAEPGDLVGAEAAIADENEGSAGGVHQQQAE